MLILDLEASFDGFNNDTRERALITHELALIQKAIQSGEEEADIHGYVVSLKGVRLETLGNQPLCCSNPECTHKPAFFAIEKFHSSKAGLYSQYHLNLYGIDEKGREVLFTHDHTLARGLGGPDSVENTTMMCLPCNTQKSKLEGKLINRKRDEEEKLQDPEKYAMKLKKKEEDKKQKEWGRIQKWIDSTSNLLNLSEVDLIQRMNEEALQADPHAIETPYKVQGKSIGFTVAGFNHFKQFSIQLFKQQDNKITPSTPTASFIPKNHPYSR